jgi:non-specific serine/threonine protein kinase/serine/threonine-protein kinase
MAPARWRQVKSIFDQVVEAPSAQREAMVEAACAGDAELRQEVESLLAAHQPTDDLFDQPAMERLQIGTLEGRRLGPYRVIREIGRGGMGSVYLGVRDDDQFQRRVAIKTVKGDLVDDGTRRRFQRERETLACLEHPNIVMLLDSGTAEDGTAYLVMDYVEGIPIDTYCETRNLTVPERLALFRSVCGALHYAHQNLVVHRDLKPANVLVTAAGVPKVLDFGIAKLLRPDFSPATLGLTRTEFQPMTPQWASPEQVLGQPVTTATDIYSLGAVLYKLLTSHHPLEESTTSPFELEQAVVNAKLPRPSECVRSSKNGTRPGSAALSRRLRGDLDTIVMKAMRKEPQRRYASAEHLAEDIRRHLEALPVTARGDSITHRLSRFVSRNRTAVAAGILCVATLAGSAVVAQSERVRAERRFNDLRHFANFVLNDLDESLRSEGVTPARKKVVARALQYLDALARESGGNDALERELVNGYLKVGDVQGNLYQASTGDSESALASYRKALQIAGGLAERNPDDPANRRQAADATVRIADIQALSGNRSAAAQNYDSALKIYDALLASDPADRGALLKVLNVCVQSGSTREQSMDVSGALDAFRGCLPIAHRLVAVDPSARGALALVRERIAVLSVKCGLAAGAEEDIKAALAIYEQAAVARPGSRSQRNVAKGYKTLAEVQRSLRKYPEALLNASGSLARIQELLDRDPKDRRLQIDYHMGLVLLIDLLHATGDRDAARAETARAVRFLQPLAEAAEPALHDLQDYVLLLVSTPFPELRNDAAALRFASIAAEMTSRKDAETLDLLARALERNGRNIEAAAAEREALALMPPLKPGQPVAEVRLTMESNLRRFETLSSAASRTESQQR